jgi:hypothetical protein
LSHEERYGGARASEYSAWHRRRSVARFVGSEKAQLLSLIDVDGALFLEFCDETKEPLALIETARDVGQARKVATVTARLAQRAGLPSYTVLYRLSDKANPADPAVKDVAAFRLKRTWPYPESGWRTLTPQEYCDALLKIRAWSAGKLDKQAANDDTY